MTDSLTPLEVDLLRAAFQPERDAATAWQRWRNSVDWDGPIDSVAFALLPRICRNLQAIGVDDPLFPRFKGIARQAWVGNQNLKASIREWVAKVPTVEFMALPPTSVLLSDSTAVRSQGRWFHFAVRPNQAAFAIRSLLLGGWKTTGLRLPNSLIEGYVLGASHIPLELSDTDTLTLTWRLEHWFGDHTEEIWSNSDPIALGDHSVRSLCRTDAVTFMLRQPVHDDPIRWVSDVLSVASAPIDWPRVLRYLARRPLSHECSDFMPTLTRFLDVGHSSTSSWQWPIVPSGHVPAAQPIRSPWRRWRQDWATYQSAWGKEYRLTKAIAQLPGYLMGRWGVRSLGGLPRGLARWL